MYFENFVEMSYLAHGLLGGMMFNSKFTLHFYITHIYIDYIINRIHGRTYFMQL